MAMLGFHPSLRALRNPPISLTVIPAKAGIHRQHEAWIPAFAGMTLGLF
jgi:hypothetical protein